MMLKLSAHHITDSLTAMRDAALTLLYPQDCLACGAAVESWRDGIACVTCWQQVTKAQQEKSICTKCGLFLDPLPAHPDLTERECGRCRELAFLYARSCGAYDGALRETVLWLKTHPQLSPRACEFLRETFQALTRLHPVESIIPVPLHPARMKARGFNQAEVIARALASATGLEVNQVSLVRERKTEMHRAGMSVAARAESLQKAFRVRAPRLLEDRAVLIVDDTMTTGSTAHEIATTLLANGARSVCVLTLARARHLFH